MLNTPEELKNPGCEAPPWFTESSIYKESIFSLDIYFYTNKSKASL